MGEFCLLVELHHEGSALQPVQQACFIYRAAIRFCIQFFVNGSIMVLYLQIFYGSPDVAIIFNSILLQGVTFHWNPSKFLSTKSLYKLRHLLKFFDCLHGILYLKK